jgi:phage terminase large subunit-like protein
MSYDQDLDKFAGTSRHFVHFDEEPPHNIYVECMARLIDTGGSAWITMTPIEGMTWVYDILYEPGIVGNPLIDVIEVSMTENPHLDKLAVEEFLNSLDADERKAREEGKFVQLGGLVYKAFDAGNPESPGKHIAKENWLPPKEWLVCTSLDHGLTNPTAWLWHAVSPDGQVITFHEIYQSGQTVDTLAARVLAYNRTTLKREPDYYIGDPSIRNTEPISGTSIHLEYIKFGVPIVLGNNDVIAGINRVSRYLKFRPDGQPNWAITANCANLIREMKRYRWETYSSKKIQNSKNLYETPHKKDDHACDSARYFFMSRPDLIADVPDSPVGVYDKMGASRVNTVEIAEPNRNDETQWEARATQWTEDELGGDW